MRVSSTRTRAPMRDQRILQAIRTPTHPPGFARMTRRRGQAGGWVSTYLEAKAELAGERGPVRSSFS